METLRIVVADDHPVIREGLRSLLEARPGWSVVAEACDGTEAVEKVSATKPHVTVLDIRMPELSGLEAAREIIRRDKNAKILILTIDRSDSPVRQVVAAGARGFMLKSDTGRDLINAIEALSHNRTFFTSDVADAILDGYLRKAGNSSQEPDANRLTPRQLEITKLLAEGKTGHEIASALGMSIKTFETHRSNIMRRLDVHSIAELVRYALRNEIVQS
jgi:DNA-binding NarL/FixJ family response regulator